MASDDSSLPPVSKGEAEVSQRSSKKPKHTIDDRDLEMVTEEAEEDRAEVTPIVIPESSWANKLFPTESLQPKQQQDTIWGKMRRNATLEWTSSS